MWNPFTLESPDPGQIIHQLTFGILKDPDICGKKTQTNEGDVSEMIEDITYMYSVFERFSIFQIIGKNPKINKFFFDEKSSKTFRVMEKYFVEHFR